MGKRGGLEVILAWGFCLMVFTRDMKTLDGQVGGTGWGKPLFHLGLT